MLGRLLRMPREEYPPERPPVYGCDTLDEHMESAAWDIKLHGLKGCHAEAAALYNSLFDLGGNMADCTDVVLGFPELAHLAFARRDELAACGVDVEAQYAATQQTRAFNEALGTGAVFSFVINAFNNPDADRR